jgi:hypothetical protein
MRVTDQKPPATLEERLRDDRLIEAALRRAMQDALLQHKRAGNPVPIWREGRVVWIPPEEIVIEPE